MAKSGTVTIEQLAKELARQVKLGKGKKKILLSNDDEGNGYHEMFFFISDVDDCMTRECQLPFGLTEDEAKTDYVILG